MGHRDYVNHGSVLSSSVDRGSYGSYMGQTDHGSIGHLDCIIYGLIITRIKRVMGHVARRFNISVGHMVLDHMVHKGQVFIE